MVRSVSAWVGSLGYNFVLMAGFFFFFFVLQWVRLVTGEYLAEILFLWWLGVFAVASSFLPVGGCGSTVVL